MRRGRRTAGLGRAATTTQAAGGLLLREVEQRTGIIRQFAACFADYRDPELVEHTVEQLVAQRIYGLALGYEDLNDHDRLRFDPLLATLVGKEDPTGQERVRQRDRGKALAGKSTLNRLELTPARADEGHRYKKIPADMKRIEGLFVELFLQAHPQPPERIVLDFDATDGPVHGDQLGRFFHGYYREYCFLPLYLFCGDELFGARGSARRTSTPRRGRSEAGGDRAAPPRSLAHGADRSPRRLGFLPRTTDAVV